MTYLANEDDDLWYMYTGQVPPLCMVEDIISLQKCSNAVNIDAACHDVIEADVKGIEK